MAIIEEGFKRVIGEGLSVDPSRIGKWCTCEGEAGCPQHDEHWYLDKPTQFACTPSEELDALRSERECEDYINSRIVPELRKHVQEE